MLAVKALTTAPVGVNLTGAFALAGHLLADLPLADLLPTEVLAVAAQRSL